MWSELKSVKKKKEEQVPVPPLSNLRKNGDKVMVGLDLWILCHSEILWSPRCKFFQGTDLLVSLFSSTQIMDCSINTCWMGEWKKTNSKYYLLLSTLTQLNIMIQSNCSFCNSKKTPCCLLQVGAFACVVPLPETCPRWSTRKTPLLTFNVG